MHEFASELARLFFCQDVHIVFQENLPWFLWRMMHGFASECA
jgi:hypothetical protein